MHSIFGFLLLLASMEVQLNNEELSQSPRGTNKCLPLPSLTCILAGEVLKMFCCCFKVPTPPWSWPTCKLARSGNQDKSLVKAMNPTHRQLMVQMQAGGVGGGGEDGSGPGGDQPSKSIDSWLLAAGIQEAESIYREAHEFALKLTRSHLTRNFNTDRSRVAAADSNMVTRDTHSEPQPMHWDEGQLVKILRSKGASLSTGQAIVRQLSSTSSPYLDGNLLCAKLEQLEHLLPGVDIAELLVKDLLLLEIDLYKAVQNMVIVSDRLPGVDLMETVCNWPGLLGCSDLESRLDRVIAKLKNLLPQWKTSMLEQLIQEYSVLIFRLDMHLDKSFSELPMDIQNMLAVGGGGGGTLFRSWKLSSAKDEGKD